MEEDAKSFEEPQKEYLSSSRFHHQSISGSNQNIVHAITGVETEYKMGTKDEYLFYVIMDGDPLNPKNPRRLYFSSPEEYEEATGNHVPPRCKERFKTNRAKHWQ